MPTAFTGSPGWTGLHPLQLGGPPLISTWSRPLASKAGPLGAEALPLLAHAYLNDGVTPATTATFGILNRPAIKATTANGGYEQITLQPAAKDANGNLVATTGPALGLTQGNVIRLTELGGPFPGFVYGGVIESFPDTLSPAGTKHEIVVSPFGWELTRVATQLLYTAPVDAAQMVRDAVALTQHCSCDQASVPMTTGALAATSGTLDFRGQKVTQVLDTARSIAGPTWYWYCDELGRVWFQYQGSGAVYTFMGGQHYQERVTNGGDIQDRINRVQVAGVPSGSASPPTTTYNGSSQSTIGVRALEPPILLQNCSDHFVISAIAANVGAALDQTWTRVQLKGLPPLGVANERHPGRVHGSQPGGAMIRYWEPSVTPLPETGAVAGYVGPFICQSVEYDGLYQQIEAGNIPVTNHTDIDNLVKSLAARGASVAIYSPYATTIIGPSNPLGNQMIQAIDQNGQVRYQAGALQALGISPAQIGWRVIDGTGSPIADSIGQIQSISLLGSSFFANNQVIGPGTLTQQSVTGSPVTFTPARTVRVLSLMQMVFNCNGNFAYGNAHLDGSDGGAGTVNHHTVVANGLSYVDGVHVRLDTLDATSHTIEWKFDVDAGITGTVFKGWIFCFQLGG